MGAVVRRTAEPSLVVALLGPSTVGTVTDGSDDMTEIFESLNQEFYSTEPHAYFGQRLNTLLVAAADVESLNLNLRGEGQATSSVFFRVADDERVATQLSPAEQEGYITAESQVLLHHAAEALLRLYLAHEDQPPCPWVEVSSLTDFSEFKDLIRSRFVDFAGSRQAEPQVARVFFGQSQHRPDIGCTEDEWKAAVENVAGFLRHFAGVLLDDASLYNAAKHGFAVNPTRSFIRIAAEGSNVAGFGHEGPSMQFLERTRYNREGTRDWNLTTAWVRVRATLCFTDIALRLMANLWTVARAVYVASEDRNVWFPTDESPLTLQQAAGEFGGRRWSRRMFEERKQPR